MLDLIVGIIMLIFFFGLTAYSTITKDFNYDLKFLVQMAISGGGAFYILFYQNWNKIMSFLKRKEGDDSMEEESRDKNCCMSDKDMQDYATLVYLRKRAQEIQSQEMLDLVVKLNSLLFSTALQNKV